MIYIALSKDSSLPLLRSLSHILSELMPKMSWSLSHPGSDTLQSFTNIFILVTYCSIVSIPCIVLWSLSLMNLGFSLGHVYLLKCSTWELSLSLLSGVISDHIVNFCSLFAYPKKELCQLNIFSLSLMDPRNKCSTVVWNFHQVSGRLLLSQIIVGVDNPVSSAICNFFCLFVIAVFLEGFTYALY